MINRHLKLYCKVFSLLLFFVFLSGCGSKEATGVPKITYGNPAYKHMADLPRIKYDHQPEKPARIKKETEPIQEDLEGLGDLMSARKNYFMACLYYDKALEKDKNNLPVAYKKAAALLAGGDNNGAELQFQEILEKQPDFAKAHEGLGRVNFSDKDYDRGIINFKKAVELDNSLWISHNFLGNIYDFQGKHLQAIQAYKSALAISPHAGFLHNNLGVSLYLQGDSGKAVNEFLEALNLKYENRRLYNNLGLALCAMEQYDKALKAFKNGGSEASAYNNLGCAYLKKNQQKEAALCFKKAIEISPQFYGLANENLKKLGKSSPVN